MPKNLAFFLALIWLNVLFSDTFSQEPLMINTSARKITFLDGKWHYIVDPYENGYYNYRYEPFDEMEDPSNGGYYVNKKPADKTDLVEYNFDEAPVLNVPGDWNTQDDRLFYYEGSIWYKRSFDYAKADIKDRVFLYFGAVNYQADVYMNGIKLGQHTGGFTPFDFEITGILRPGENFVIIKVDNTRKKEGVPTLNTDWWNYGGITREVKVVEVPPTFIRDYFIHLKNSDLMTVAGYVTLDGKRCNSKRVTIVIRGTGITATIITDKNGYAPFEIEAKGLHLWSPDAPVLYDVDFIATGDTVADRIGLRTIKTRETDILLNGKPIFLRGISIHEENPLRGNRAYSEADARLLLGWVKELNGNFARLAHYPHNENMAKVADEMGVLLWEEIPVYWTIDWENTATFKNARRQLTDMITRDKNRASVIIWSVGNETPVQEMRTRFMATLISEARNLDSSRLISAALEQHGLENNNNIRVITDPLASYVDILSFNEYIGWYDGLPGKCDEITWKINQQKPVIISEFGAGALLGFHGDSLTRWSEEYQEYMYRKSIDMLVKIPQLRGMTPWILADFRSPRRPLPGIQDGWNRKGLIAAPSGSKKKAFYVLQKFYKSLE